MAQNTIKSNQATTITPVTTAGSKVSVQSCRFRYTNNGMAQLVIQFHITSDTTNGETLVTLGNIKPPKVNITVPTISSSNPTKYGNINLTTGGAITSGGSLPTAEWYAVSIAYVY